MNPVLENKLAQLDREREAMYQTVAELSEAELHDQAYGWSIIQVFAHLNAAEIGSVNYMRKKMQAGDQMKNFSIGNRLRALLSNGLLKSSLRWKAPKFVSNPEDQHTLEEMKALWANTREETKTYVAEYPEKYLAKAVYKHPFAGRLDLARAIDSLTYHQRHHMHQIKRIKKVLGKK